MAKPRSKSEFVLFNVVYEDGSQRSNRRVAAELFDGIDDDEVVARRAIADQDREIAEKSGNAPLAIDRVWRVGAKEPKSGMRERA